MQRARPVIEFVSRRAVAVGEAMVELAPAGGGLLRQGYAGDTFNTAWHMAQLLSGRAQVGFVTRIGTDALSNRFAEEMRADGLDLSGVARDPERRMGLYLIELDGVERSFHYWRRDSAARRLADDRDRLKAALEGAGLIHVSGITLAILAPEARASLLGVLAELRRAGAVVSFDPNIRPRLWSSAEETRAGVREMLGITDIALPSFDDEAALWGDASPPETISRLRSHGVQEAAVKDGSRPVWHFSGGEQGSVDTAAVPDILDTTGAGDAFNAGYLALRLIGHPQHAAVVAGQRLSAEVIRHPGARAPKQAARLMASAQEW